jgi:hypothetical protein
MTDAADQDVPTPTEASRASAGAVGGLPALFMFDAATYAAAAAAGYEGLAFYFCGRGGVLGDVDAGAVTEAFAFFAPEAVAAGWESGRAVEDRAAAAQRWADAAADWARHHLPEGAVDYRRLAELAGKVVAAADVAGAPIVAGWRELPEPDDPRAAALHQLNGLRELRNARHAEAVAAAGISPLEAVMVRSPHMVGIFGWPEPHPEPDDELRARWQAAEDATDERFGQDLAVLDAGERAEFVELADAAQAAAT